VTLATRIMRLERAIPPAPGCTACARRLVWPVDDAALDASPRGPWGTTCPECGRPPKHTVKVLRRSLWGAL
jgi:hypothetical protein